MKEAEKSEMNELAQLTQMFATACKKAVEEGKVCTYTTPVVTAALVLVTAGAVVDPHW